MLCLHSGCKAVFKVKVKVFLCCVRSTKHRTSVTHTKLYEPLRVAEPYIHFTVHACVYDT